MNIQVTGVMIMRKTTIIIYTTPDKIQLPQQVAQEKCCYLFSYKFDYI